jgi:menaquinone reductase, multiheme cytochrome c subunit
VLIVAIVGPAYAGLVVLYGFSPQATDVGYAPQQPIAYSHALHAGELGIDCRYCHVTVENAAQAALPPTQTCINCHSSAYGIRRDSPKLQTLLAAYYGSGEQPGMAGLPIPWVRVHDLPDYAYFDHSAHVRHGVGCVECHGRVDRMEVVYQVKPLSMSWCLECHRDPAPRLRPVAEITNMAWTGPAQGAGDAAGAGARLLKEYNIRGVEDMQSCSLCHR